MIRGALRLDDPSETRRQGVESGVLESLRKYQACATFAIIPFRMVEGQRRALSEARACHSSRRSMQMSLRLPCMDMCTFAYNLNPHHRAGLLGAHKLSNTYLSPKVMHILSVYSPLLQKPVQSDNAEKWRSQMSPMQIRIFESAAGNALQEHGYALMTPAHRLPLPIRAAMCAGTILLWYMLRSHPRISLPTGESHFFIPLFRAIDTYGDLTRLENIRAVLAEMYRRFLEHGCHVRRVPEAIIQHRIQTPKLRRSYFLDLHFRQGRTEGSQKRTHQSRIPPAYLVPQLWRAVIRALGQRLREGSNATLRQEMNVAYFIGYLVGWSLGQGR